MKKSLSLTILEDLDPSKLAEQGIFLHETYDTWTEGRSLQSGLEEDGRNKRKNPPEGTGAWEDQSLCVEVGAAMATWRGGISRSDSKALAALAHRHLRKHWGDRLD